MPHDYHALSAAKRAARQQVAGLDASVRRAIQHAGTLESAIQSAGSERDACDAAAQTTDSISAAAKLYRLAERLDLAILAARMGMMSRDELADGVAECREERLRLARQPATLMREETP